MQMHAVALTIAERLAIGTYISTKNKSYYNEGAPYQYEVNTTSGLSALRQHSHTTSCMEMTIGKPDLKPSRDTEHTLRLSHNTQRWSTYINGLFRHCNKPNMAHYERTTDDKLIYTQINQKAIDLLHLSVYASYWILPNRLQASYQHKNWQYSLLWTIPFT